MQITKETQRAHVILATSEYSFLTWLTESEPPSCLVGAMRLQQLTFLSHVELQEGFFTTEVIGDFPEPEARTYLQRLMMSKSREVTDKEWASVFAVRHRLLSPVIWFGANVVGSGVVCCIADLWRQCWLSEHHCPVLQNHRRCSSRLVTDPGCA